jgi:hypothetical protein
MNDLRMRLWWSIAICLTACGDGSGGDSSSDTMTTPEGPEMTAETVAETEPTSAGPDVTTTDDPDTSTATSDPTTEPTTGDPPACAFFSELQGLVSTSLYRFSSDLHDASCNPTVSQEEYVAYTASTPGYHTFYMYDVAEFPAAIFVIEGVDDCSGAELGCDAATSDDGHPFVRVLLVAEQRVFIGVETTQAGVLGEFSITSTLSLPVAPSCDFAFNEINPDLGGSGTLTERDLDDNFASCGDGDASDEMASFIAPADGDYTFTITPIDFDALVYATTEACDVELACVNDGGPGEPEVFTRALVMGEKMYVGIDSADGSLGGYFVDVLY